MSIEHTEHFRDLLKSARAYARCLRGTLEAPAAEMDLEKAEEEIADSARRFVSRESLATVKAEIAQRMSSLPPVQVAPTAKKCAGNGAHCFAELPITSTDTVCDACKVEADTKGNAPTG